MSTRMTPVEYLLKQSGGSFSILYQARDWVPGAVEPHQGRFRMMLYPKSHMSSVGNFSVTYDKLDWSKLGPLAWSREASRSDLLGYLGDHYAIQVSEGDFAALPGEWPEGTCVLQAHPGSMLFTGHLTLTLS